MTIGLSRKTDGDIFSIVPAGTILPFAGDTAPEGWLICDGTTLNRSAYSDLFSAIGTAWGNGDGTTTFHLPDLRGRFLRGVDAGEGNDPDASSRTVTNSGGNSGDAVGSLQDDAIRNISGQFGVKSNESYATAPFSDVGAAPGITNASGASSGSTLYELDASTQVPTGGDNRPKNAAVNYIIRIGTSI